MLTNSLPKQKLADQDLSRMDHGNPEYMKFPWTQSDLRAKLSVTVRLQGVKDDAPDARPCARNA